jgi:DNA repair protein RadC
MAKGGSCAKPRRVVAKLEAGGKVPAIRISGPNDVVRAVRSILKDNAYESFVALYLNTRHCVIGYEVFTEGGIAAVSVQTSAIVRDALLAGAIGIVTAHNHPSGSAEVSRDDKALFQKLERQADVMDIKVLDHVVLGDGTFASQSNDWVEDSI